MQNPNSRIERLKELLGLEEQREKLQREIDSLTARMQSLQGNLFNGGSSAETAEAPRRRGRPAAAQATSTASVASTAARTVAPKAGRGKRMKRGQLKDQIVNALHAAGNAGVRVTELAKALGIKPVNIHSWFHSALNRYPQIKKLVGGHYRLEGKLEGASESEPAAKKGRGPRVSAATKTAKPASQPARSAGRGRSSGEKSHSKRGELSAKVLSELQGAGAKGITVKDLSEKIGAPYKNIYIWFATTGKKNPKVKKVGPAQYRLAA